MYQRLRKPYCRWVIILALILRLLTEDSITIPFVHALDELRTSPDFIRAMVYLGSGEQLNDDAPPKQPGVITLVTQSPETEAPEAADRFDFAAVDAAAITIGGSCTYDYDKQALLEQPIAIDLSTDGPKVLIVHTHGSEAYADTEDNGYHTTDLSRNVNRVGDAMAEVLEAASIPCLHITGCIDTEDFYGAYDRMEAIIQDALDEHPSIRMVIDVHRDAYLNADGSEAGPTCAIGDNGPEAARLMLVMGSDEGGRYHPNWQDNLSCAMKLQALLNDRSPGLCRDMLLRQSRYNQHFTPCSVLVEVGAAGNTLEQAVAAGREFAGAVVRLLNFSEADG